ncbi:MAG TPA: hypothetical protein VHZ25_00545, partial [Acidobacteriaceae bacterium]|nr:hypothetical protein [Acidobacteriaceae bacterium]
MAAFLVLALYFQNTKSGLKSCQICLGVLAWKLFGISVITSVLTARDLTDFPHLAVLDGGGGMGDFGHGTEVLVWRMEDGGS